MCRWASEDIGFQECLKMITLAWKTIADRPSAFFFYRCFVLFLAFYPDWSAAQGQIFFIYFLFTIQVTWTVLLAYGWHSIKICCLNDWILCWELKDLTITSSWVDGCSTISQKWAKGLLISRYKGFPQQIIVGQLHKEKQ